MRAKITYLVTAAVLVFYFALVGTRGVMLIQHGTLLPVTFGVAVLILPGIGVWFLWKNTQFVQRANRLAAELDSEGGLPADELARTPSGRIYRASADAVFQRRKEETEDAPDDDYVVETKVRLTVPAEGCCFNYVQAGLVVMAAPFPT